MFLKYLHHYAMPAPMNGFQNKHVIIVLQSKTNMHYPLFNLLIFVLQDHIKGKYTIAIKLSIFLYDPNFRSSGFFFFFFFFWGGGVEVGFSTCTLVFWLPNLIKFDWFHSLPSMNGALTTQYYPGVHMQE